MSITSETQRRYDAKKGGYAYFTLFRSSEKGERPEWAQDGDILEENCEGGGNYECKRDAKGRIKWEVASGWDRQTSGGSSEAGGGGGAEKFVVTLTEENDTWTADKTVAEIVAADAAGKDVVVSFQYMGQLPTELPKVSWVPDPEGTSSVFMFSGIIYGESEEVAFIVGQPGDSSDMWQVTFTPIPTSTNAPLVVTLTAGQEAGQFVGNKTHKEAYDAFIAGQNVVFYAPSVGLAETVTAAQNDTSTANPYALSTKSFASSGVASDYITVTVGG